MSVRPFEKVYSSISLSGWSPPAFAGWQQISQAQQHTIRSLERQLGATTEQLRAFFQIIDGAEQALAYLDQEADRAHERDSLLT